ncbi:MAG: deoxyribose-phosphate aldolase [Thermoprotei archaeon]|nr:MAG: deoxyribose-phosphate aldolase [Thermoprotei archaeon]RLE90060.1 MAG: deoxyribose-phosphate aldolase [Thermoprotei archaeon]
MLRREELLSTITIEDIASKIDHTVLKPDTRIHEVEHACTVAKKYGFAAVVVPPVYVERAVELLKGTQVKVCSVVSFPMGYTDTSIKVSEIELLSEKGATEVDVVANIYAIKNHAWNLVEKEISEIVEIAHDRSMVVKIIIETNLLTDEEKIRVTEILIDKNADYVKTNTGFLGKASIHDVLLLNDTSRGRINIKAAGGIRHIEDTILFIRSGAKRIGTSTGDRIIEEYLRFKGKMK